MEHTINVKTQRKTSKLIESKSARQNGRNLRYGDHGEDEKEFLVCQLARSGSVAHVPDIAKHLTW